MMNKRLLSSLKHEIIRPIAELLIEKFKIIDKKVKSVIFIVLRQKSIAL